jgi:hypothetical protein
MPSAQPCCLLLLFDAISCYRAVQKCCQTELVNIEKPSFVQKKQAKWKTDLVQADGGRGEQCCARGERGEEADSQRGEKKKWREEGRKKQN